MIRSLSITIAALALALGASLGCQVERVVSSDGRRMPPKPRPLQAAPAGTVPTTMAFMVGSKPEDSNGNGFPDMISVMVFLFAPPHDASIPADGAFEFELYRKGQSGRADSEPMARWRREGEDVALAAIQAPYGTGYQFRLCLLDGFDDLLPLQQADLLCRFEPAAGGRPFRSNGIRTIQIGRRLTAAASGPAPSRAIARPVRD